MHLDKIYILEDNINTHLFDNLKVFVCRNKDAQIFVVVKQLQ